nr:restriction endonuclease subunit S [uncultured Cohaesibacter sp.]
MTEKNDFVADEWTPVTPKGAEEWAVFDFDDFFQVLATTGKKILAKEYQETGTWPVIDQGAEIVSGYTDDETKLIKSDKPVLVFGDHTRCMKFINSAFAPGADGTKLLVTRDAIDPRFAYHLYFAIKLPNRGYSRHFGFLRRCSFPVPPLNEQRRIVERIEAMFDEIDHGVENLKKAKTSLGLYRQSLLKSAFEGRLTADWRAKNADKLESPESLLARIQKERDTRYESALKDWEKAVVEWRKGGEIGKKPAKPKRLRDQKARHHPDLDVPSAWGTVPLVGIVSEAVLGKMLDKQKNLGTPRPYLGNINLRWGRFVVDKAKTIPIEDHEVERYGVRAGDLVICEGGEPGRCAVWNGDDNSVFVQKALHRVRFTESYNSIFAFHFFAFASSFSLLDRLFTGSTIKHLTGKALDEVLLPLCSPAEQAEIARILDERLSAADALETEIDASLARADALRQSILKQAFSGKLVPQDPNDEPASVLLERIKAEKTKAPKARRKRKATA